MAVMALGSVAAQAEGGLRVAPEQAPWPRWQARIGVDQAPAWRGDLAPAGNGPRSMKLLGDYYLSGPGFGQGQVVGGLRATGGVLLGSGSPLLGASAGAPLTFSVMRSLTPNRGDDGLEAPPVGYLGIGYSSLSLRGGWGFSADLGVTTGAGLRPPEARTLDDAVRELRLRPVLQLGVSYAF
ncbi:hypothetical protein [Azohydromonas aeria]|uniref:hypothetical protein n=1 Tax=Azohydromonas aeria TaxID=2590212 RepID=UPI0012FC4BD9|nr:hypothetical protein [Azohydromonas aeria]